jgi:hypothetical protein
VVNVVEQNHRGLLLVAVFGHAIGEPSPDARDSFASRRIRAQPRGQLPKQLARANAAQVGQRHRMSGSGKFTTEDLEQTRLAGPRLTQEQPDAAPAVDEETKPSQRLFVHGGLRRMHLCVPTLDSTARTARGNSPFRIVSLIGTIGRTSSA